MGIIRNTDAARLRDGLDACRDVDPVAEYIPVVVDDIADVDAEFGTRIRLARGTSELRSAMPRWTSTAQRIASTTLLNSARNPSPVFLTVRPR